MKLTDLAHIRLNTQHLNNDKFKQPEEVVAYLGAVQSQDYGSATYALGLRMQHPDIDKIQQAFDEGKILRTHVMRPTWHFVSPKDIVWLQQLTRHRVHKLMSYYNRQLGLDEHIFEKAKTVIYDSLKNNNYLTRLELKERFDQAGIPTEGTQRLAHLVMMPELDGLICSGPLKGKQHTYALLEERAPHTVKLTQEEALAELTNRYFTSHGPATLKDFSWWSGLTLAEITQGLELIKQKLEKITVDEISYYYIGELELKKDQSPTVYLLPNYDEYGIGYTNHDAIFDRSQHSPTGPKAHLIFNHTVVLDGQVVGSWKRTIQKKVAVITVNVFMPLTKLQKQALDAAAKKYGSFFKLEVELQLQQ